MWKKLLSNSLLKKLMRFTWKNFKACTKNGGIYLSYLPIWSKCLLWNITMFFLISSIIIELTLKYWISFEFFRQKRFYVKSVYIFLETSLRFIIYPDKNLKLEQKWWYLFTISADSKEMFVSVGHENPIVCFVLKILKNIVSYRMGEFLCFFLNLSDFVLLYNKDFMYIWNSR